MLIRGAARRPPSPPPGLAWALALAGALALVAAGPTPGRLARVRVQRRALHAGLVPSESAPSPKTRNASALRRQQDPIVAETRTTSGSTFFTISTRCSAGVTHASPPADHDHDHDHDHGVASAETDLDLDPNIKPNGDQTSLEEIAEEETTITRAMYHAPPTPSPANFYVDDE